MTVVYSGLTLVNVLTLASITNPISKSLITCARIASFSIDALGFLVAFIFAVTFVYVFAKSTISSESDRTRAAETTNNI